MARLELPSVTLVAATSVNVAATVAALRLCLDAAGFADCVLFTDAQPRVSSDIKVVPVAPMTSAAAYSHFMLTGLVDHVRTEHILVVQWDGFILNPEAWDKGLLTYDYIGAPWPQFSDGHDVGNGGFSLRSRRLLEACRDPLFQLGDAEDLAIARTNRRLLEERHGVRFADHATAARFSYERSVPREATFGFHGMFNMPDVLGIDAFWTLYKGLDERSITPRDYRLLVRQLGRGKNPLWRQLRFTIQNHRHLLRL